MSGKATSKELSIYKAVNAHQPIIEHVSGPEICGSVGILICGVVYEVKPTPLLYGDAIVPAAEFEMNGVKMYTCDPFVAGEVEDKWNWN